MRFLALPLTALLILLASALAAPAHKIVGQDGKIHACYKVKGKPRGALRAVRGRAKCRRGERKVAWAVGGPAAQTGATGATGAAGSPGADAPTVAALSERIDALTARVEKLEGVVAAVCPQVSLVTSLLPTESFSCQVP